MNPFLPFCSGVILVLRNVEITDIENNEGVLDIKANVLINDNAKEIGFTVKDEFLLVGRENYNTIKENLMPADYEVIDYENKYFISFEFDPEVVDIDDYIKNLN